ncbi:hypothetical protein CVT25_003536 [Psilocybe cyanescens]|uniref:HIG1 domain-containing protein n=1 Tax=Psilocybe cyanescens TaxID=93625 RepID=A0A409X6S5_PSICY|nr:hypothetical protein CVT25_003536 [Psilocybe cyanescens]
MSTPAGKYQDPLETWSDKFARKFKENPWVPLGCIATCGALFMSAVKLRAGKPKDMNYWLRARVGLQGVTVVALLLGSTWGREWMKKNFGVESTSETAGPSVTESQAQKKAQEKLEFEERMRNAEEATNQEEAVGMSGKMTVKGPTLNKPKEEKVKEQEKTSEAVKNSKGWRLWSKGSSSSGSDGKDDSDSTKTS